MSIDLDTASKEELLDYARDELGLKIHHATGIDKIQEKIAKAEAANEPPAPAPEEAAADAPPPAKGERTEPKRFYTINIPKTGGVLGSKDVPVTVNGKAFLIKRGVDVDVPDFIVEALRNAVEDVFEQDDKGNMVSREAQSYPFNIVG